MKKTNPKTPLHPCPLYQLRLEATSGDHPDQCPFSRQSQLEQVAPDLIQGFECLHGWNLQSLSGKPFPAFDYPHGKKMYFLCLWIFLYFSLHPLPLALSLDTASKTQASSSLLPPIMYLSTLPRSPLFFSSQAK